VGRAYFFLGDKDSALLNLRQAVERNHESVESHLFLAATLDSAGQRDAAGWEKEEIRSLEPAFKASEWLRNYPMADTGQRKRLTEALAGLGL
jgi:Tfp pilus assembly protein PilF